MPSLLNDSATGTGSGPPRPSVTRTMTFASATVESVADNSRPHAESPSEISVVPVKRLRVSRDEINDTTSEVRLEIVRVSSVNADPAKLDPVDRMLN